MKTLWNDPETSSYLLKNLPFPLGILLQNFLRSKRSQEENHHATSPFIILETIFSAVRFSAVIAIAEYTAEDFSEEGQKAAGHNRYLLNLLENPSDGDWVNVLAHFTKMFLSTKKQFVSRKLFETLSKGQPNLLQILKKCVQLRNRLIHPSTSLISDASKNLEDYFQQLLPLWLGLCRYKLIADANNGKTLLCQGFPPFELFCSNSGTNSPRLVIDEISLTLFPFLHITFDENRAVAYFYNKRSQHDYFYMSYQKGGQNSSGKLQEEIAVTCKNIFTRLEQNALPKERETRPDIMNFEYLCSFHGANFVGRDRMFSAIDDFIAEKKRGYALLTGEAGIGKTAFVAALYQKNIELPPEKRFLWHFCAHSDERDNPQYFLRSMLAQGYQKFPQLRENIPYEVQRLHFQWLQFLEQASKQLNNNEKLVVIVDALDEGMRGDDGNSIPDLLPDRLPDHVLAIVTARIDLCRQLSLERLKDLTELGHFQKLTQNDIRQLLVEKIGMASESVTPAILAKIWHNSNQGDPLYLRFLADALRNGSLSLHNMSLMPVSLEDFFDQIWLELPEKDDFLAYRLLGMLAIMQTPGDDSLFCDLLDKSQAAVGEARFQMGKLLVSRQENYTLFHERFREYIQGKFRDCELGNFHRELCLHYDAIDENGRRNHPLLSEKALLYLTYHAYHYGKCADDYQLLYHLLDDSLFCKTKEQGLRATRFLLDDLQYGVDAAMADYKNQLSKGIDYALRYIRMTAAGRKNMGQRISQYIESNEYPMALYEISLLSDEQSRYYQLLLLAATAAVKEGPARVEEIIQHIQNMPPNMDESNWPVIVVSLAELFSAQIPGVLSILPKMNPETALELFAFDRPDLREKLTDYLSEDEFLWQLIKILSSKKQIDFGWGRQIIEKIHDPKIKARALVRWAAISKQQQDRQLLSNLVSDMEESSAKIEILSDWIKILPTAEEVDEVFEIICHISDEGGRLYLAGEILLSVSALTQEDEICRTMAKWLEQTSSPIKKSKLWPIFIAYHAKENLEEVWLQLDEFISDLGQRKDPKENRQLIDAARALAAIAGQEVKQDLALRIIEQIYQLSNNDLRNEIMMSTCHLFRDAGVDYFEQYRQLLYQADSIFPWPKRANYLAELAAFDFSPEKQKEMHRILLEKISHFPQGKLHSDVCCKVATKTSLPLLRSLILYWQDNKCDKAMLPLLQAIIKNLCRRQEAQAILEELSGMMADIPDNIRRQAVQILAWAFYVVGDTNTALTKLYQGQRLYLDGKEREIHLAASLSSCYRLALLQKNDTLPGKILTHFKQNLSDQSSWRSLLQYAILITTDNEQKFCEYMDKSFEQIMAIVSPKERFLALSQWLVPLQTLKQLGRFRHLSEKCRQVARDFEQQDRSSLLVECNRVLATVENAKEARRFLADSLEEVRANFTDPSLLYRTMGQIVLQMYSNPVLAGEADSYIEEIWLKVEQTSDPILLASLLRTLRPFGAVKRRKQAMEKLLPIMDSVEDYGDKAQTIKDVLWSLNGIVEITRLQRLLEKLLQTIPLVPDSRRRHYFLIDIGTHLDKLEEIGLMENVWSYAPRICQMVKEISDPYYAALAFTNIGMAMYRQQKSEAQMFAEGAREKIEQLRDPIRKSRALAFEARMISSTGNCSEMIKSLRGIPLLNERMFALQRLLPIIPVDWLSRLMTMTLESPVTFDMLLSRLLENSNSPELAFIIDTLTTH